MTEITWKVILLDQLLAAAQLVNASEAGYKFTIIYVHFVVCRLCYFTYSGTELQPYSCTGHFQTDFVELCRRVEPPFVYTPAVISRPRRPRSPVPVHVVEEKTTKPVKSSKKEEPEKSETPGTIDSGGCLLCIFTVVK